MTLWAAGEHFGSKGVCTVEIDLASDVVGRAQGRLSGELSMVGGHAGDGRRLANGQSAALLRAPGS